MSDLVGRAISKFGMVENVGVAVEISFIVVIHAQESCIYADFNVFGLMEGDNFNIVLKCHMVANSHSGKVARAHPSA